jgi:hypothetical protein
VVVLTNTNWRAIDTLTSSFRTYQCSLSADAPSSPMRYQQLGRSLFLGFYLQNSDEWQSFPLSTTGIIDFPLMGGGPSPNPFRLDKDKVLTIPFWHSTELFADVLIFSISMELKFKKTVRLSGGLYEKSVSIQPSELRDILATGVYFIYVQSGGREQVWKVAVIK